MQEQITRSSVVYKFGLIIGLVAIIYSILLYLLDLSMNKALGYVNYVFLIGGIVWGLKTYRDQGLNGFISFGKAFTTGFYISVVAGVISAIWAFIFFKFINPEFVEIILQETETQMMEQGQSEEVIEQTLKYTRMFMKPSLMAFWSFLFNIIGGAILSLIIGAIMRKDPPATNTGALDSEEPA